MYRTSFPITLAFLLAAGCVALPWERTVVEGTGPDELLKLRAGPGLGFRVLMGLPEGTVLRRKDCVTEEGQLWCQVSPVDGPGIEGFVSADYLSSR